MPRPPVKKTEKLAKAQAYGEEMGRLKARGKMKIQDILTDKLINVIDRIDPLQLAAVLSLTYVYKTTLDLSEEWATVFTKMLTSDPFTRRLIALFIGPLVKYLLPDDPGVIDFDLPAAFEWAVCFTLAYLTVVHGAEAAGGIVKFAKGAIGK